MMALIAGCRAPWPAVTTSAVATPTSSTEVKTEAEITSPLATEQRDMVAILDELEAIEAIDPQAKEQLMADLRETKQENWPLIVMQFKSALAYRQQLLSKETEPEDLPEAIIADQKPTEPAMSHAVSVSYNPESPAAPQEITQKLPSPKENQTKQPEQTPAAHQPRQEVPHVIQQTSSVTEIHQELDWQAHLEQAIQKFERETNPVPSTTADVHQQMRLRMLKLIAGHQEDALSPVTGATPAVQDYWNKQMFSISTFLDSEQADDKQRACSCLVHLDQARAKLAELASLQVRNMSFVSSVDGFGLYDELDQAKFSPGEQVSLYCEVQNFQSRSTKEGYQTRLGTSYEVVDLNGQRVDAREFPDVEDICRNTRRDFHMQYGIDLPTRIYPGKYELRVIITDQLSQKIGQTSVPFEIVE